MQLIVVSDIFGNTPELQSFIDCFRNLYKKLAIVDPYHGKFIDFVIETDAYEYFQTSCNISSLAEKIIEKVEIHDGQSDIIGFSIGASALWKMSDYRFKQNQVKNAIGFYGSRIRNMINIDPRFKIKLIFPFQEDHFSVDKLMNQLADKDNVHCEKTIYKHGFMNKRSTNFNQSGYSKYLDLMIKLNA